MPEPILVAEGVRKVYRSGGTDVCALKGLALEVPDLRDPAKRRCSTVSPASTTSMADA